MFVLEHFSCEKENERQIPLALYIRLEYKIFLRSDNVLTELFSLSKPVVSKVIST